MLMTRVAVSAGFDSRKVYFYPRIARADRTCRLKRARPMLRASMCTDSRATYLCMNIGLSSARACFRERANHFSRAMAPKSGATHAHAHVRTCASTGLREAHVDAHGGLHRDKSVRSQLAWCACSKRE